MILRTIVGTLSVTGLVIVLGWMCVTTSGGLPSAASFLVVPFFLGSLLLLHRRR